MTEWQVIIDSVIDQEVTEDELVELAVILTNSQAAISGGDGSASVVMAIDVAETAADAIDQATEIWHSALVDRGFTIANVVDVKVSAATYAVVQDEMDSPTIPQLGGANEVAEVLGVSRQRVHQIAASNDTFPRPVARAAMGPLWTLDSVRAWKESGPKRRIGRPPKIMGATAVDSAPAATSDHVKASKSMSRSVTN